MAIYILGLMLAFPLGVIPTLLRNPERGGCLIRADQLLGCGLRAALAAPNQKQHPHPTSLVLNPLQKIK